MSLPLHLAPPGLLAGVGPGDEFVLGGEEGRHAAIVRRTRPGEQIRVADGLGQVATARVVAVDGAALRLAIGAVAVVPEPDPRFVLVQALAKGGRDEQAIEAATELGVDEVVPWQSSRSIARWRGERVERGRARWAAVLRAATKQSRRARIPSLHPLVTTPELASRLDTAEAAYVLHEEAVAPLAGRPLPPRGDVLLVVGPEGGIPAEELEVLTAAGAEAVRLGATVLRSSSAGPAALAVLNAAGRWR